MHHANVNATVMVESVIQIKSEIMIIVGVSVKTIIYLKKIIIGILLHVVEKNANNQQVFLLIQD